MSRRRQAGTGGYIFHVLNRGNRKMRLFESRGDYELFLKIVGETQAKVPVRCLAYCLMPNHFHFVLWPSRDGELSEFMRRLTMRHSKCWHVWRSTTGTGHVYQGRFKAIPVSTDEHFLCLCRYVERNPLRAGLVRWAEDWAWSSCAQRAGRSCPIVLSDWPIERPGHWFDLLRLEDPVQTEQIRHCTRFGIPLGPEQWRDETAFALGLTTSPKHGGRPGRSAELAKRSQNVPLPGLG